MAVSIQPDNYIHHSIFWRDWEVVFHRVSFKRISLEIFWLSREAVRESQKMIDEYLRSSAPSAAVPVTASAAVHFLEQQDVYHIAQPVFSWRIAPSGFTVHGKNLVLISVFVEFIFVF